MLAAARIGAQIERGRGDSDGAVKGCARIGGAAKCQ